MSDSKIKQSHIKKNGMLGIYIHDLKDSNKKTDVKGADPLLITGPSKRLRWQRDYISHGDWANDDGYNKMGDWIEAGCEKSRALTPAGWRAET